MKKNNNKLLLILIGVAFLMLGAAYAFVPLYNLFCKVIGTPTVNLSVGEAGKPKPVKSSEISERTVNVRFVGGESADVPVTLTPVSYKIKARLGESILTAYRAENLSDEDIEGVAVHTILAMGTEGESPYAENYIDLQQCFCFEEQFYPAKEEVTLPLSFHVTPDLPEEVHTITFSYTLFKNLPE